jgi:hypothetical protein
LPAEKKEKYLKKLQIGRQQKKAAVLTLGKVDEPKHVAEKGKEQTDPD